MKQTVENERTKLTANALDRASTACLAIGVFAPLASLLQGNIHAPALGISGSFVGWILAAIMLHILAKRALGGLLP